MCDAADSGELACCAAMAQNGLAPQVERPGKARVGRVGRRLETAGRVPNRLEARQAPALGFQRIHRPGFEVPSSGVGRVIGASSQGTLLVIAHQIEDQRPMRIDGRVQAGRGQPGAEPDTA